LSGSPGPRLGKGPDRVACCRDNWPRVKHTNNARLRGPVTTAHAGTTIPQTRSQLLFQDPGICKVTEDFLSILCQASAPRVSTLCACAARPARKTMRRLVTVGAAQVEFRPASIKGKKNQCRPSRTLTNRSVLSRSKIHFTTAKTMIASYTALVIQ
jgi:hypothetical protein